MSAAPRISVIMATYNHAPTLPQAIESVLKQDVTDFEFIIVNDGSTDESDRLIRTYLEDPRIKYVALPNGGQTSALNAGLKQARGVYAAFLDSDDEYLRSHLITLMRFCEEHKLDFALGSFELILCGDQREVLDYYDPSRTIPIAEVECITGILFGKKDKILQAGGFQGKFLDIGLFDRMKKLGYAWKKCPQPTYRYYFGRYNDNLSRDILRGKITKK